MNWYKRYLGDYRRKTAQLTMLEHAAYGLLMDEYYATASALPAQLEKLNRICHAANGSERKAVKVVADQYFPINCDGTRHNKRCDEEIARFSEQSQVNSAIAKMRWSKQKQIRTVYEPHNESLCLPEVRYQKDLDLPKSGPLGGNGKGQGPESLPVQVKTLDPPDIERNRAIAQALAEGNTDEAQRLRENP